MKPKPKKFIFNIPISVYDQLSVAAEKRNMARSVYLVQVLMEALSKEIN